MPRKPTAKKTRTSGQLLKPGMIATATALFWAALNTPAMMTPATLIVWALGTLTIGLLARAALALAFPGGKILLVHLARFIDELRAQGEKP